MNSPHNPYLAARREWDERYSSPMRREHKRAIRAFAQVMAGLADLGVNKADLLLLREILTPYLQLLVDYFPAPTGVNVNNRSGVHVHTQPDLPRGAVSKSTKTHTLIVGGMEEK